MIYELSIDQNRNGLQLGDRSQEMIVTLMQAIERVKDNIGKQHVFVALNLQGKNDFGTAGHYVLVCLEPDRLMKVV